MWKLLKDFLENGYYSYTDVYIKNIEEDGYRYVVDFTHGEDKYNETISIGIFDILIFVYDKQQLFKNDK